MERIQSMEDSSQSSQMEGSSTAEAQCNALPPESSDDVVHRGQSYLDYHPCRESTKICTAVSKQPLQRHYSVGVNPAQAAKQKELCTESVRGMAEAAKRKSDALRERNATAIFSRDVMSGTVDAKGFFNFLVKIHLARIQNCAKLTEVSAAQDGFTDSENDVRTSSVT